MPRLLPAITVAQPYSSAIARGLKPWETRTSPPHGDMCPQGVRGYPGLPIQRGERIAIHAAATWYPGWCRWYDPDHDGDADALNLLDSLGADTSEDVGGSGTWRLQARWAGLPLGAVVATARVVDALGVIDPESGWPHDCDTPDRAIVRHCTDELIIHGPRPSDDVDISDQVPLGDWTPGRWAWQLDDVQRLATPVPCRGRQGVWRLPDDVTEAVS